ncbi:DUF2383 domain-containing protein [Tamlana fucoidanivorans]|uniref:DUF2383 domain-containing protein n=1 Tax=Allotamlana fucoidanivorans TaxID=2583814 RepID=A0A5C4SMI5_9FLAO|nr:DUF2383 domain-containing protein [Tamlana fucoidanivorans]TNJ45327.1 DUF2383 domain-containing protein [Tamlana fucoidanivorans]
MKKAKLNTTPLNELLSINHYAEKLYLDALNEVEHEDLKHFFRAMAFERNEFCRFIGAEIIQLGGHPKYPSITKNDSNILSLNFKNNRLNNDYNDLVEQLIRIKTWSIDKYTEVLKQHRFSEELVQLLTNQKNILAGSLRAIKLKGVLFDTVLRPAN